MDTYDLKIEKGTKQDIDELEQLYYEITDSVSYTHLWWEPCSADL